MKENDEDLTELERELWEISEDIFDNEVWNKNTKEEMKELSKRETAKTMFGYGFIIHQKIMDEQIKSVEEAIKNNPEIAKEALEKLKKVK